MHTRIAVAFAVALLVGCSEKGRMDSANQIFESELQKRHVSFTGPDAQGRYMLESDSGRLTVSLENIARNYERDGDPETIIRFLDQTLSAFVLPEWKQAESLLYLSAEPSDHQFGRTIRWPVSESVNKVLVLTDLQEGKITWITPGMLAEWGVSQEVVVKAAEANMDRLLQDKEPELAGKIDGKVLGMIPVDSVFKASSIFAPSFKGFISRKLDWPVLVVIPCRDFIYVLSEKDKALLDKMGAVVQREYRQSGYPITTEVLRVSDNGIEAIGKFPE
jgi:uncharacterized protein YtpQ (UPF0354 family)